MSKEFSALHPGGEGEKEVQGWEVGRQNGRCFTGRKVLDVAEWFCKVRMENSPLDVRVSRSRVRV